MSLLKWDSEFHIEDGLRVCRYVAKERNKYFFKVEEVMRWRDDALDFDTLDCWQKAYLLDGYVIDNKYHTHPLRGWFYTEEDAMAAAEADLITKKLEGKI